MATSMIPEIQYQPCTVEVCCGKKKEERVCSKEILKKACPILHDEIENFQFGQSAPIRINATPEAFDAGMRFLLDPSIQNLPLDEFKAIGLLDFAWKYQSPELQQVAEPLCQHSDFADLHAASLLNYHSTFLTNNLWTGKQDQENELLAEISRRGSQVLNYISDSKKTFIVDTVKKILEQQRLNVFNEKEVFDCIQKWRNKIVKAVEENEYDNNEFVKFEQRWKKELLPLIRFEFFSINDVNNFLDEHTSPLSITEKETLLHKNRSRNIGSDTNFQLPVLTLSGEEFSPGGGLNLEYLSKWRGDFIPFTERTMLLKSEEKNIHDADEQTLNIQPLNRDLYLLSVRLYNLQDLYYKPNSNLLFLLVEVIREEDKKIVSATKLKWKNGWSKYCRLSYPCLLQKGQKYRLKVTNRESKLEIQTFYQPACDGQEYEDILRVCGIGNIFGFTFAIAKTSQCIEMLGTSV